MLLDSARADANKIVVTFITVSFVVVRANDKARRDATFRLNDHECEDERCCVTFCTEEQLVASRAAAVAPRAASASGQIHHVARYNETTAQKSQLAPCSTSQLANYKCGFTAKQMNNRRRVMVLKFGRIAVVSTAALTIAAATIPTNAGAADLPLPRRPVAYSAPPPPPPPQPCCQVYAPPPPPCCQVVYAPPPPPCCQVYTPPPPPCCVYGGGWSGGGYFADGYGGYSASGYGGGGYGAGGYGAGGYGGGGYGGGGYGGGGYGGGGYGGGGYGGGGYGGGGYGGGYGG
jgi:hypothetical protein